jgi:hypothetical protein
MEHRGVRYTIRIGIERGHWRVAVYPLGSRLPKEDSFREWENAEITARSMINAWLKSDPRCHRLTFDKLS